MRVCRSFTRWRAAAAARDVASGASLHAAFQRCGVISGHALSFVSTGEQSGSLVKALDEIARSAKDEAERRLRIAANVTSRVIEIGTLIVVAAEILSKYGEIGLR
jgi:type II secretory pathway component PulF